MASTHGLGPSPNTVVQVFEGLQAVRAEYVQYCAGSTNGVQVCHVRHHSFAAGTTQRRSGCGLLKLR